MEKKTTLQGKGIVVVDRGFVYVGDVECDEQFCVIKNAQNIRVWGTTDGLGELATKGPTSKTKLDTAGTVRVPNHAVISIIDTQAEKWTC